MTKVNIASVLLAIVFLGLAGCETTGGSGGGPPPYHFERGTQNAP